MFRGHYPVKATAFADDFLAKYTAVGFGALSKREVDLLLLKLLQDHLPGFREKTDFDAARELRTTKRRIRGLRDEISYREAADEETLKARLRNELAQAEILSDHADTVMVQLDDAVLRGYAERIVRSEFGIVDTSFNSAILKLSGEKFLLLAFSVLSDEERKEATRKIDELSGRQVSNAPDNKTSFKRFRDAFISGAGDKAGKMFVSGAFALITSGASLILESVEPVANAAGGIRGALERMWKFFSGSEQGADGADE